MKRIDLWRAKLKMSQAELKIVTRKANALNKRRSVVVNFIEQTEKKIAEFLAKT